MEVLRKVESKRTHVGTGRINNITNVRKPKPSIYDDGWKYKKPQDNGDNDSYSVKYIVRKDNSCNWTFPFGGNLKDHVENSDVRTQEPFITQKNRKDTLH